jgi:hypothetical protein
VTVSAEVREQVWEAVEVANAIAPSNARIARKKVLLVTEFGTVPLDEQAKKIPIADKGTPLRPKTYTLFKDEIDKVYDGAF